MDKTGDVRRVGATRFSLSKRQIIKQYGLDSGDGDGVVSEKSKKETVRRFGTSSNEDSEMGCVGSGEEDELRPTTNISKRFKLPKKFLDDCNTVDHASVPRKLRSATKKRSRESVSPPLPTSRKVNYTDNGGELRRKHGMKKSKLNAKQGESEDCQEQAIVGSITKDEEEVAETLFALAGMFSETDKTDETKSDGKLSESKFSALPESSTPAFEVMKEEEESKTIFPTATAEAANHSSSLEGSAGVTATAQYLNEASQPDNSNQFPIELANYVPQVNPPTSSLFSKSEPTSESVETGSKQTKHDETPASERKQEIALGPVAAFSSQIELEPTIKKNKNNALWPGLSSSGLLGADTRGPSLKPSSVKLPAWLGNAASATQPFSSENRMVTGKDTRVPIDKKNSWKRCSAHVYISRLTKVLQITEIKDRLPMQSTQLTTDEGSKRGALLAANNIACSDAEKSPNEVRNAILLHKRLLQDQQQQASTSSMLYASQKQSFDLLSVSTGDCGVEAMSGTNRAGNGVEAMTQFHIPYMHSLSHNHTIMPLSLPQNRYSSTSFPDHLSAAAAQQVQIQLPPYLCSSFPGHSHIDTTVLPKQHQQQIWTAQPAGQYRPGEVAAAHLPSSQNGRLDFPSLMQYAQFILPPNSHPSLEVLGPKYATISPHQQQQQQQQFISATSLLPPARVKRQHNLPSGYEGNVPSLLIDRA